MSPIRRVWVTRTQPGAARTALRLADLGFEPVVAPVLAVRPIPQPPPDLTGFKTLAFTSPNGVAAFTALSDDRSLPVFTVGDATAERARLAGYKDVVSANGALSDLAWLLAGSATGPVLAPGPREPAGDLDALLSGAVEIMPLPVYEAVETGAAPPEDFEAVLLHSPRAAWATSGLLGPNGGAGRIAVAISPNAATALGGAAFDQIRIAGAPTDAAVLQALGKPAARV